MTPSAEASGVRLGLRENWQQFSLLVLVNAFVGGMVGLERTVVPLIGSEEFTKAADPMDAKAFARYLTEAFARPGYVYQARPMRVSLSKSKPRATVTRAVRESVVVAGSVVVTDLHERLTVERDGRRLLIRKLRKAAPAASEPA